MGPVTDRTNDDSLLVWPSTLHNILAFTGSLRRCLELQSFTGRAESVDKVKREAMAHSALPQAQGQAGYLLQGPYGELGYCWRGTALENACHVHQYCRERHILSACAALPGVHVRWVPAPAQSASCSCCCCCCTVYDCKLSVLLTKSASVLQGILDSGKPADKISPNMTGGACLLASA